MDIRSDRQKGLSYTELGKKYHMDPRTAKRYADSPQRPEYTLTGPKPTKLDAYKQKIDQWLEEAPYSAVRILEKLQEEGFDGKYSIVKEYVRGKKMDLEEKATVRFETMPGKQGQMDSGAISSSRRRTSPFTPRAPRSISGPSTRRRTPPGPFSSFSEPRRRRL